jgi:hypothetical protein
VFLEDEGLSVYVDSVVDPQLDREKVTVDTAELLRGRMNRSRFLLYTTSTASTQSRWMPWELGYFHHVSLSSSTVQQILRKRGPWSSRPR